MITGVETGGNNGENDVEDDGDNDGKRVRVEMIVKMVLIIERKTKTMVVRTIVWVPFSKFL